MSKQMLMDATHSEETRVVVLDGERLEDLDVETSIKKQIKGNIYLAKVIRVEPSLQAAFVEYGGNRHGFLAFNEIHPDYYQIPVSDKEDLKQQMMERVREEKKSLLDEEDDSSEETKSKKKKNKKKNDVPEMRAENSFEELSEMLSDDVSDEAELEELRRMRGHFFRQYKIHEVIHHNQILLVQVVKEERGNKGAALTTYLSLAGRYCVLMPNNARAGGVSRKIVNIKDRNRLKDIIEKLPVPDEMSVIVRTAGKEKTKAEIKRDFDFLMKTWNSIRTKTMESLAPALIYEEGDIIKRALRDMYTQEIETIWVAGTDAYKNARAFFKMLLPSHMKKIKQYKDDVPLFQAYQVEEQLEDMNNPVVQLKSGGYLVINQTEALVAVDVNSGRATKEKNIEETALKTNLEAAEEIARQCRLRDLAGLVVVDFIDMDEPKNNHAIERKMREVTKPDRARIQIGPITQFGLMEFSRQRLRSSFLETNHIVCPYCGGQGVIRSVESCALHKLHLLEASGIKASSRDIVMTLPFDVALYLLNHKRSNIADLEKKYDLTITVRADSTMVKPEDYRLESFMRKKEVSEVDKKQKWHKKKNRRPEEPAKNETSFVNNTKPVENNQKQEARKEPVKQEKKQEVPQQKKFEKQEQKKQQQPKQQQNKKAKFVNNDKKPENNVAQAPQNVDKTADKKVEKKQENKQRSQQQSKKAVVKAEEHAVVKKENHPVVVKEDKPVMVIEDKKDSVAKDKKSDKKTKKTRNNQKSDTKSSDNKQQIKQVTEKKPADKEAPEKAAVVKNTAEQPQKKESDKKPEGKKGPDKKRQSAPKKQKKESLPPTTEDGFKVVEQTKLSDLEKTPKRKGWWQQNA